MGPRTDPRERHGALKPHGGVGRLAAPARRVQRRIERFYGLESGPDVGEFIGEGLDGSRESLLLRQVSDAVEILLLLPKAADRGSLDDRMQLVEGVSHFVYIVERVRVGLPATALELELQAEVDKFVLLAFDGVTLAGERASRVRHALYRRVRFLHADDTEPGLRYRLANDLASRISRRVSERRVQGDARRWLMRFYRSGQTEKIRLARAA